MEINFKRQFSLLFIILALTLLVLPFITTTSEFFTAVLYKFGWYKFLTDLIVPFEARSIAGLIQLLGYTVSASPKTVSVLRDGQWQSIWISWNCIGWQSLIFFAVTLFVGLQGNFSRESKIECILIGLFGTVLINFLRIALIALLIFNYKQVPATIIHDYLSVVILIAWLFFFWYLAYKFVLEEG